MALLSPVWYLMVESLATARAHASRPHGSPPSILLLHRYLQSTPHPYVLMTNALETADPCPGSGNDNASVTEGKPNCPLALPSQTSPGPRDLPKGLELALPLESQCEAPGSPSPQNEQQQLESGLSTAVNQKSTANVSSLPRPLAVDGNQSQASEITSVQRQLAACSLEESQREANSNIAKKTPSLPRKVTPCQSWRATGRYELWQCDDPKW